MAKLFGLKFKWLFPFFILVLIGLLSPFWNTLSPNELDFASQDDLVFADIAWILTSACLVLLMTPGLSFFYGGMVGKKM